MDGEIDPDEVHALLETDEDVTVVDIRSPEAFRRGHLPGSVCIPLPRLPASVDRLDGADRVVTVCPHGEASVRAARLIAAYEGLAEDAPVESMAGGLDAWGHDLETGSAESSSDAAADGADAPF